MLCTTEIRWRSGASTLGRIARRSSPRWSALEYGSRRDGSTHVVHRAPTLKRSYSSERAHAHDEYNSKAIGAVTTSTPQQTTLGSMLDKIPLTVESKLEKSARVRSSMLLVLLTPSYAQQATDPNIPLKMFKKLCGTEQWNKPLHTVTAVVDSIPDGDYGSEGIAYCWRHRYSKFDHTTPEQPSYELREMSPSAQKPGWLEFSFAAPRPKTDDRRQRRVAQLPLARTIFTNGLVSTLIHRTYMPNHTGTLQLQKETDLEKFVYDVSPHVDSELPRLHAPLIPLTPARWIRNVMGNIVRTVSAEPSFSGSGKSSDASQPASEELEQAVTSYFTALKIQPQPVSVWALIIPSPLPPSATGDIRSTYNLLGSQDDHLSALWTSEDTPTLVDSVLNHLLPAGARLRKVLSGGGGWGKKAGLLSLDPDDRYSTRELRQDTGWEVDINEDLKEQQRQALGEVAKAGESVMFFIAPEGLTGYESIGQSAENEDAEELTAVFGSLPSSIDSMPGATASGEDVSAAVVKYRADFLGALSEEGLALNMTARDGTATRTKFDVPYSRVAVKSGRKLSDTAMPPKVPSGQRHYSTRATGKEKATQRNG